MTCPLCDKPVQRMKEPYPALAVGATEWSRGLAQHLYSYHGYFLCCPAKIGWPILELAEHLEQLSRDGEDVAAHVQFVALGRNAK